MKLALLSDIHANAQALAACLDHARAQGAQRFAVLGDLVGYGADPVAVVQQIMQLRLEGAIVLKGNHDELAVRPGVGGRTLAHSTAAWTHAQLDAAQRAFLDALPLTVQEDRLLLVHASADQPGRWHYVEDARGAAASLDAAGAWPGVRYVFGGHVHHQTLYYRGGGRGLMPFEPAAGVAIAVPGHRHWLATIGSVGQPRDGRTEAMYAVFDGAAAQLTFHRVAYDHLAAAAAIRRAGLPDYFAERLETGR
ncbi:MAG: metallophosphoesterase family protein [Rhodoferax sp.]|nr:metallophosphoesterase family protein [Rhodoferax sp.]